MLDSLKFLTVQQKKQKNQSLFLEGREEGGGVEWGWEKRKFLNG